MSSFPEDRARIEAEVSRFVDRVLTLWVSREPTALEDFRRVINPGLSAVGTGRHELVRSDASLMVQLLAREIDQLPDGVDFAVLSRTIDVVAQDSAYALLEIEFAPRLDTPVPPVYGRMSLGIDLTEDGRWLISHWHVSVPMAEQAEGESFPTDALRAKAQELEREVAARTADLVRANRGLQVEAAVERVRARAMAMERSEDIRSVAIAIRKELQDLELGPLIAATISLEVAPGRIRHFDVTATDDGSSGEAVDMDITFNLDSVPSESFFQDEWTYQGDYWVNHASREGTRSGIDWLFDYAPDNAAVFAKLWEEGTMTEFWQGVVPLAEGRLSVGLFAPPPPELEWILPKFGAAFNLAHKRFKDLEEAEARAREAQIEAALERVRSRAMSMQTPDDIAGTALALFDEVDRLCPSVLRLGLAIVTSDETFEIWLAGSDEEGQPQIVRSIPLRRGMRPEGDLMFDQWTSGESWSFRESPDFLQWARETLFSGRGRMEIREREDVHQYATFFPHSAGYLYVIATEAHDGITTDGGVVTRFGAVFDLAYKRYRDLQIAEAAAREAQIEAAFERIRSRAFAMQTSDELKDVALELRNQMTILGDALDGIAIHRYPPGEFDEYESWAAIAVPGTSEPMMVKGLFRVASSEVVREYRDGFLSDEDMYTLEVVSDTERGREWMKALREATPTFGTRKQEAPLPERAYHNCCDFLGGTIVMLTHRPMTSEQRDLLRRAARTFDVAHQRYLDLAKAEEDYRALLDEKARTEKALSDLRATQAQLVQQEKLASLGSLTAGIAHEIKNPLNFVNNFAEVNAELAEEARDALATGDLDGVRQVLADLEENATQIAKHGKRADSIVRAMMQHARGGTSERETIVVNDFLEEYATLAWHGMRARDDGFRADLVRDFAADAGSIEVMPQELGRVVLNLLNNAFDAVKQTDRAQVTIGSRRADSGVEITVADNGPGIPPEIREKIFEPFFTTKPTGEGTGLGLSLSYDIVTKGHAGAMTVRQAEAGGAFFVITLPGG